MCGLHIVSFHLSLRLDNSEHFIEHLGVLHIGYCKV